MKKQVFKVLPLLVVMFGGIFMAQGQQKPDSLMHYLEVAIRNNPTVLQKLNEYEAALQKVPQVSSLPDPTLEMGVLLQPMAVMDGKQIADFKFMQMFPWFGTLKEAKNEMTLMAKASYETFRDAKLQVIFDVKSSWYVLNKLQQTIKISERNLEVLRSIERLSLAKFKSATGIAANAGGTTSRTSTSATTPVATPPASGGGASGMQGMGGGSGVSGGAMGAGSMSSSMQGGSGAMGGGGSSSLSDLYRVQIEIEDLKNNIELLKDQRRTAVAKFNNLLNRPSEEVVVLPDNLPIVPLAISTGAAVDSILANNPMLSMLQYEQQSYDAKSRMVKRMGYPMLGVGLNYSIYGKLPMSQSSMNGMDMIMPMVSVSIPIYRKKYKAMVAEANLMKSATAQSYAATANTLQTQYYEALQQYLDSQRRVELYKKQSALAKKSLDIMVASFSASNSSLTDVLRIRQQLFDYEVKEVEAISENSTAVALINRLMSNTHVN